ncbi:hypothetical protein [Bradyrhizobium quebecense]|uniref:Solute-binding protein family 3/N-terminal domain-containing protein n=2 Tax=Bradyrhizobium quebecense TaxID=2748629 RepID=A0ABS3MGT3_9BRAD|nr:hypothetical protein [Bradyrhizobium quebecense]UGY05937.1 hypothetical protein J4P68_0014900 [Bradyrhizobium quebecense]
MTNAPVRLKVIDSGAALGAAEAFSKGQVDLAVVRSDVGDLSHAQAVIDVPTKEYDLTRKVVFKNIAPADARRQFNPSQSALIVVIPLTRKYLSQVRAWFTPGPKAAPVLIPIEAAGIMHRRASYGSSSVSQ